MLSEKRNAFSGLLNHKGSKEERKTKVGLDAIGTSTPLESNKSLHAYAKTVHPNSRRSLAANEE
jgi:hypothetical protein